jgi:hypothetical protein
VNNLKENIMENKEQLVDFIDAVVNEEDSNESLARESIINKTKSIIASWKKSAVLEAALREFIGDDSPIRLNGDDVLVNGKVVGRIKNDLSEMDSGINFISADGKFSKEFEDVGSLYQFLMSKFNVKENDEKSLGTTIVDPKKLDLVGKGGIKSDPTTSKLGTKPVDPKKLDLVSKDSSVKQDSTTTKLGTKIDSPEKIKFADNATEKQHSSEDTDGDKKGETKEKFDPDGETAQGVGSRFGKLKSLISDIKAGKRRTSTAGMGEGKDWKMENKDADGDGKLGKIKSNIDSMLKKANKSGNKKAAAKTE